MTCPPADQKRHATFRAGLRGLVWGSTHKLGDKLAQHCRNGLLAARACFATLYDGRHAVCQLLPQRAR